MAYPPQVDEQGGYPARFKFPPIPERSMPEVQEDQSIESRVAPRGTEEGVSNISAPKSLEFGLSRVWIEAKGRVRRTVSFHEGPAARAGTAGNPSLAFVPGEDDDALSVGWEIANLAQVKSVAIEVFARGHDAPVIVRTWDGDGFKAFRDLCAPTKSRSKKLPVHAGKLPWATLLSEAQTKLDTTLQVDGAAAFPDGVLVLRCAPYQVRMTVSAKDTARASKSAPPEEDALGFPLLGWTYLHVLVDRIDLLPADPWSIPKDRAPEDTFFDAAVLGAKTWDHEKELLEDVRAKACDSRGRFHSGRDHKLALESTLACKDNTAATSKDLHFRAYRSMWGDGPRLPIFACVQLKNVRKDRSPAPASVLSGVKLLWDWEDRTPHDHDHDAAPSPKLAGLDGEHHGCTTEFLARALKAFVKREGDGGFAPKGSDNCHRKHGGKRGEGARPVFPPQAGTALAAVGSDGEAFPFQVEACAERRWSATSTCRALACKIDKKRAVDATVHSGVVFQPSRMAGDCYRVVCYLLDPGLGGDAGFPYGKPGPELRASGDVPCAFTGVFEVWRKVRGFVLSKGPQALKLKVPEVRAPYEACRVDLDLPVAQQVKNDVWGNLMQAAINEAKKDPNRKQWQDWAWPTTFNGSYGVDLETRPTLKPKLHSQFPSVWELKVPQFAFEADPMPLSTITDHKGKTARLIWSGKNRQDEWIVLAEKTSSGAKFTSKKDITLSLASGKTANLTVSKATSRSGKKARALLDEFVDLCLPVNDKQAESKMNTIVQGVQAQYLDAEHKDDVGLFMFLYQSVAPIYADPIPPMGGASHSPSAKDFRANIFTAADEFAGYDFAANKKKTADRVIAHEFGHGLFLNHAPPMGNNEIHVKASPTFTDARNGKDCFMNYDADTSRACGVCNLTLRGWSLFGSGDQANNDPELMALAPSALQNDVEWRINRLTVTLPAVGGLKRYDRNGVGALVLNASQTLESQVSDASMPRLIVLYGDLVPGKDPGIKLEVDAVLGLGDQLAWDITLADGVSAANLHVTPLASDSSAIELWPSDYGTFHVRVGLSDPSIDALKRDTQHVAITLEVLPLAVNKLEVKVPGTPSLSRRLAHNKTNEHYEPEVQAWLPAPFRPNASRVKVAWDDFEKNPPLVLMANSIHAGQGQLEVEVDATVGRRATLLCTTLRSDDGDAVVTASVTEEPTLAQDRAQANKFILQPDAFGSFHIVPGVKVDGLGNAWASEMINVVLVGVKHHGNAHQVTSANILVRAEGTQFHLQTKNNTAPRFDYGDSVPLHLKTTVQLIGGGEDGLRGLDKVRGGWVNNIRKDVVRGQYRRAADRDEQTVRGLHLHRNGQPNNSADNVQFSPLAPPIDAAHPVVDSKGHHSARGWGGMAPALSTSKPKGALSGSWTQRPDQAGAFLDFEVLDAPAQTYDMELEGNKDYKLIEAEVEIDFACHLVFSTNDADTAVNQEKVEAGAHLYVVAERLLWSVRGKYNVNLGGGYNPINPLTITQGALTPYDPARPAGAVGVELYPPGADQYVKWRRVDKKDPLNANGIVLSKNPDDD